MATVRAKEAFSYNDANGLPVMVAAGALFDSNDPDVKKRAHLFEDPDVAAARRARRTSGVEDATSEPGEKRSLVRPKKRPGPAAKEDQASAGDTSPAGDAGTDA